MRLFAYLAIFFAYAISAFAQPSTITYQGVLTDNLGAVVDGNVNIAFALYDQSANGTLLWNETHNNVQVANGLFQVELNSLANNWGTANFASNMWLEITVGATTLTPRVKFNANGYSINAGNATTATSASTATTAATATNFSGNLTGDVTGTQGATVVSSVGGTTAANLASGATLANAATNLNTANAIVRRDPSGNFSAGTISANLVGNVTGSVIGNASTSTSTTHIAGGSTGSIPYQSGAGTTTMLAAGTNGHVLTLAGGVPTWAAASGGGGISPQNTPQEGDLLYFSTGNWVARRLTMANNGSGNSFSNMQPYLVLNYCIALSGLWPTQSSEYPFIGEIELYAFNYAPNGFAQCNGQILAISSYSALYALLGTTYGGNGSTTFALPDLRGRVPIHQGQGPGLSVKTMGQTGGTENTTLLISNMPTHNHTITYED